MTDASYEVSDDFIPVVKDGQTRALVSIFDQQNLLASAADAANKSGQLNLITDVKKVEQAVQVDRRSHVESVIIKVMKKLRECPYEKMLEAVLPLLRFGQKAEDVEVRVEHLVKRGSLEMTVQDVNPDEARDGDQGMQVDEGTGSRTKRILKYAD